MYGERRGVYRDLVGKCEGKLKFRKPNRRWKDNLERDLHEF
jgi:hypothetical protein